MNLPSSNNPLLQELKDEINKLTEKARVAFLVILENAQNRQNNNHKSL